MKIVVIGGGPSGFAAAISAAENGAQAVILERMNKPALKLLASGGGRCNITNTLEKEEYAASFGREGRFMLPVLNRFYHSELFAFFKLRGLTFRAKDGFHYFPESERASDVFNVLQRECERLKIPVRPNCTVVKILTENSRVSGVITESGEQIEADAVILAAGGCSWPGLGGSMRGLKLAEDPGHTIAPPFPAMAPLIVPDPQIRALTGITLQDAALEFHVNRHTVMRNHGELLFTHTGLSGPCALDLAGDAAAAAAKGPVKLNFILRYGADRTFWLSRIKEQKRRYERKEINTVLAFDVPSRLAGYYCGKLGINGLKISMLTIQQTEQLANALAGTELTVTGAGPMDCAMAMKGGIRLKEINPETLESRIVQKLFFAGEIMDLTGPCGGYNLQWAFSSGFAAGKSAAISADKD